MSDLKHWKRRALKAEADLEMRDRVTEFSRNDYDKTLRINARFTVVLREIEDAIVYLRAADAEMEAR